MSSARIREALRLLHLEAERFGDAALTQTLRALEQAEGEGRSERWVSASVAARLLEVSRSTVSRWASSCERKGAHAIPGGVFYASDFRREGRSLKVRLEACRMVANRRASAVLRTRNTSCEGA